ncbi:MAG: hypothetical protein MZV70_62445 [Desulfobacterales bacterium]|nr:hypothetical protein [Desulfobacterales bacterium]
MNTLDRAFRPPARRGPDAAAPARPRFAADLSRGRELQAAASPPVPTSVAPGKVEVVEVFWYACGHCYAARAQARGLGAQGQGRRTSRWCGCPPPGTTC